MALEHTLEDVYASSASAAERPTGVHRRTLSERPVHGTSVWPFRPQAYAAALEQVSDAVLITDRSGTVRYANDAGRALVERARPEGQHLLELLGVDGAFLRSVLRDLRDNTVWRGTATLEILGKPRELDLTVSAVTVSGWGRAHGFSVIARSRTSHALQVTGSARHVLATMMRVAGTIAHDFNNQIAVVLNYSFILLRELASNAPAHGHVEELQQAAWRAADTARHLLRLADKRPPDHGALDANQVIREAHTALSLVSRSQSEIELRLTPEPCMVKARQPELEWLLLDLTQRLRSRLGEPKRVRIATSREALGGAVAPRVRIAIDAFPAATQGLRALQCEHELPKLSAQLGCELALQPLPNDGLRYVVELPGA